MSVRDLPSDLGTTPEPDERVIRRLVRALDYSRGFWLGFAKSNTPAQRRRLSALCKDLLEPLKIRVLEIELNEPVTDLLPVLRERLAQETATHVEETATRPKLAIFVHGLERSVPSREAYPPLLSSLNLKRELFRQEVPHPLLLWLPDYALTAIARKAPDFWAWRSGLYEFAPERETAEQSLKAVRAEALHATLSLSEQAKRERLVLLKGLIDDYRELGDGPREQEARASLLNDIGLTQHRLGEWAEAEQAYKESLTISRALEDAEGEAIALNNMARIAQERGESEEAQRLYGQSLELARRLDDQRGVAITLHNLAMLAQERGEAEEAQRLYNESWEIKKKVGSQSDIAITLHQLGVLAYDQGDMEKARSFYNESLEIEKALGNRHGSALTIWGLGNISLRQGELTEAKRMFQDALETFRNLGDQVNAARVLHQLGIAAEVEGSDKAAAQLFREALNCIEKLRSPDAEIIRRSLARVDNPEAVSE